jgi:hypothetical protein
MRLFMWYHLCIPSKLRPNAVVNKGTLNLVLMKVQRMFYPGVKCRVVWRNPTF